MLLVLAALWIAPASGASGATKHALTIADLDERQNVTDAQISPDGLSVLYTVARNDFVADIKRSSIWQVDWDGGAPRRLTDDSEMAAAPRWRPDGRSISFLKAAKGSGDRQVWLFDTKTGAKRPITNVPGGVIAYTWSPDGSRLALIHQPPAARVGEAAGAAKPGPWVIDRYRFKIDEGDGYRHAGWQPPRIYIHDLQSGTSAQLTAGDGYEEAYPAWSPDGRSIAFVSNRGPDRDRVDYTDIYVVEASAGSSPRRLTTFPGMDTGPLLWNAAATEIFFRQGGEPKYWMFEQLQLAAVSTKRGSTTRLTDGLDRDVDDSNLSQDGASIQFVVADNRSRYLARLDRQGAHIERLLKGPGKVLSFTSAAGRTVVVATFDSIPPEVFALDKGQLRQLTHHNDAWRQRVDWAPVEDIEFTAKDGETVNGLLTRPVGYEKGRRYPTILWIHGGPHLQDEHGFTDHNAYDPRQLFAANGYAVVQINYRGSRGRGARFGQGTFADWGKKDVSDLLEGIDHVVGMGIADPGRLGVGGWSFGGFLTDYLIVSDTRFKAAISGAGSGNKVASYGADLYSYPNELEFGPPWQNPEAWLRVSRPLFQANRARTPTLFVGGAKDFNVPIAGSEQMYQALKSLDIPTQLVIYPGEHHMIERPSFERDLLRRYLDWFDRYLRDPS